MSRALIAVPVILLLAGFGYARMGGEASHDRQWRLDQAVLPYAEVGGDIVRIHNIRNFRYAEDGTPTPAYYDKEFNVQDLEEIYFVVEPFSRLKGAAHVFLSFEFKGNDFLVLSVESRREKDETFNSITGLFNRYELIYVYADERDAITRAAVYREHPLYIYPASTTPENMRALFLDTIARTNELYAKPEFYNSLGNSCVSNVIRHVNIISPGTVPLNWGLIFPAYSARVAYDLGLIETDLPLEEAKARYRVNERVVKYRDDPDFSRKIRGLE